ncbi:Component of the cap-binding complex (CBC) [Polyplax serrata]|uniref:Component of the cap-binding complex (CBC) n=1 Tax=Polyplax serrata TaxID=468196 RepID=A0AAN8SFB7_POLSC
MDETKKDKEIFVTCTTQEVQIEHHEQVQKYSSTLETLLFTSDLDLHILDVFHQFVSLRS